MLSNQIHIIDLFVKEEIFRLMFNMKFNKYQSLLSLKTEKSEWSICVRAQSIWKGINMKTNEFRGFNIIFIDEEVRIMTLQFLIYWL